MTSITNIELNFSEVNCAVVVYAKQNDKLSRHIAATLYDGAAAWTPPAGSHGIIRFLKPDGTSGYYDVDENEDPAISISGNVATMTIVEQALTVPGDVYMELNFYNGDGEKLTTLKWLMRVQQSVLEDSTIVSSDYYNVLTAQVAAILGATTHPPYINSTSKNWMLWDEDNGVYVDSGYSSVGTQGPTGPQGVSITSVTKQSGTGAAGTTDVYKVNLSNGSSAGTFNVYNGSDGQGSPGSAMPKVDSGTGVVGTANAYSREDHQHPLNVSSADPEMDGAETPGDSTAYARSNHVHPRDTSKAERSAVTESGADSITAAGLYTISDNPGAIAAMYWDSNYSVQFGNFVTDPRQFLMRVKSGVPGAWGSWIPLVPVPVSITLTAGSWTSAGTNLFSQAVSSLTNVTAKTKVDLCPDGASILQMVNDGTYSIYISNSSGTLTAYAVGGEPSANLTISGIRYETT